jgi:hypothetical protein
MQLQTSVMNYAGNGAAVSLPKSSVTTAKPQAKGHCGCENRKAQETRTTCSCNHGEPDFSKMTPAEKVAYHKARWDRILG